MLYLLKVRIMYSVKVKQKIILKFKNKNNPISDQKGCFNSKHVFFYEHKRLSFFQNSL